MPMKKPASKTQPHKGKLLYYNREDAKKRVGDNPTDIVEKTVKHAEDVLFCKYYEKKNGKITKITVKAPGGGKEYTLSVKKGEGDTKTSTHSKSELVAYLKKTPELTFMLEYIDNANTLARAKKSRSKSKSKSKSKSRSKSKGGKKKKKGKSKSKSKGKKKAAKKTKSKSRSKSKGKKRTAKRKTNSKSKSRSRSKGGKKRSARK